MDRKIIYPGQIPLVEDQLHAARFTQIGIGRLGGALYGEGGTGASGFACTPSDGLSVTIAPGEIIQPGVIDTTAFSVLPASSSSLPRQFILTDSAKINVPGSGATYIVYVTPVTSDTSNGVLPYYNSANPSQTFAGQSNSGASQATVRSDALVIGIGASVPKGATPLWSIVVPAGASTITSSMISPASGAPFYPNLQEIAPRLVAPFNQSLAAAFGGYGLNSIVSDPTTPGVYWRSTAGNNTTVPGASGAAWVNLFSGLLATAGDAQSSSAATTFTNGLSIATDQVSGNKNQYSPPLILQSNGLGKVQQFYANINGAPQAATELYSGSNRIAYSALNADGSITTNKGSVAFLTDVLRVAGDPQTSSSPTTFNNGLATALGVTAWNATNPQVLSVGDAFASFARLAGTEQTVSANTSFSAAVAFSIAPTIPLGLSNTSTSNANVLSVGDAFASFARLAGTEQTVSANTSFSAAVAFSIAPTIPLGLSNTSTSNANALAVGDAFRSFVRLGGNAQTVSAPTTFTQNTLIATDQVSGAASQFSPSLNLQSNGLGRVALFYANLNGNPQLSTELYSGSSRIAYSALLADGSLTTNKGVVAFTSDLTGKLIVPGATNAFIQTIQAQYNASDGANGTLINLSSAFPNKCLHAFGNDVGSGVCTFGTTIVNNGQVRIFSKLGTVYQTGGINLITIGY